MLATSVYSNDSYLPEYWQRHMFMSVLCWNSRPFNPKPISSTWSPVELGGLLIALKTKIEALNISCLYKTTTLITGILAFEAFPK